MESEPCKQRNTAQTPAALYLSANSSHRWNWSTAPPYPPSRQPITFCAARKHFAAGTARAPILMACAPCASMAAWAGLWLAELDAKEKAAFVERMKAARLSKAQRRVSTTAQH